MFKKVLICNRGEIALRIIRTCRDMGIKTVQVYSKADADSRPVELADEAILIGPAAANRSYLHIPSIIHACIMSGADAVHPGYGFLSESPYLAEICEACNIKFIGPGPQAMRLMGDKSRARRAMMKAGVPVLPGSVGVLEDEEKAVKAAKDTGFPVILKASAGGGGRGIRIVRTAAEVVPAFRAAQAEAAAAFGVPDIYIEKYLQAPRHIEIQIIADTRGNVVHLGERECSIQRRHQKLVEEAPSPIVNDKLRKRMGSTAVEAAKAVQYVNAGTIEFLLDASGNYFFMEMNTRIQVEHGVTELITGRDLVKEQIRVAAGEPLSFSGRDLVYHGHAIECRINAEDPQTFVPSPGIVGHLNLPGGPGVRVDTFLHDDCEVLPFYDSLIAKVMAHGRDRAEAIARMRRCLDVMVVEGIKTNVALHRRIMDDPDFRAGRVDTSFMERFLPEKKAAPVVR